MKTIPPTPARARFHPKQYLRAQDLTDEQAYHMALRRRHAAVQHVWGIVHGLELEQEGTHLFVQPGSAIDGFGREIVVATRSELPVSQFDTFEADVLEVWLCYDRIEAAPAPAGYGGCATEMDRPAYRWREVPRFELRKRTDPPAEPRDPPAALGTLAPWQIAPPDDPAVAWPVYLGTAERLHQPVQGRWFDLEVSRRPYVGVVAASVEHPAGLLALDLGPGADAGARFAVVVPGTEPRALLEIASEGAVACHGPVEVEGNVTLTRGALELASTLSPTVGSDAASIYRVGGAAGTETVRIDLGKLGTGAQSLVVGFTAPDGTFQPCLEVKVNPAEPTLPAEVTIYGDLDVQGALTSEKPQLHLSEDAKRAIAGGFMAGLSAAMS